MQATIQIQVGSKELLGHEYCSLSIREIFRGILQAVRILKK